MAQGRVGIVGAGIVGASAALALAQRGWQVTLFDPAPPGGPGSASYGNAGMVQTGTPAPMAAPGLLRALPRLLVDRDSALILRWRALPRFAPWLVRFVLAARPDRVEALSVHLASLLDRAGPAFDRALSASGADDLVKRRGMMFVFRGAAERAALAWEFDLFQRRGVAVETIGGEALRQAEPALDPAYTRAEYLPGTFFSVDPGGVTAAIARAAVAAGARIRAETVADIAFDADGRPVAVAPGGTRHGFDRLVLAAGVDSRRLFRQLGLSVPLETGRGYHVMLPRPGVKLNGPVVDAARHCGIVPMRAGLRIAGLMELAHRDAPPANDRAAHLAATAARILPGLGTDPQEIWMGHRPITPDSLPVIGAAPRHPNVLLGFGHGQLGFTMGPLTGEILADLVAGSPPAVDLAPFRPDRFGRIAA